MIKSFVFFGRFTLLLTRISVIGPPFSKSTFLEKVFWDPQLLLLLEDFFFYEQDSVITFSYRYLLSKLGRNSRQGSPVECLMTQRLGSREYFFWFFFFFLGMCDSSTAFFNSCCFLLSGLFRSIYSKSSAFLSQLIFNNPFLPELAATLFVPNIDVSYQNVCGLK